MIDKALTLAILAVAIAVALTLTAASSAVASNTIAKQENLACTSCHDKPGSKLLTSKGKYYEHTESLAGYEELIVQVGQCTSCHVRKPGSTRLTSEGKQIRSLMGDMEGLKKWVLEGHPLDLDRSP